MIPSPVIRGFFIPFRVIPDDDWNDLVIKGGVVFDRCRISELSPVLPETSHGDGTQWAQAAILAAVSK
jgi:hypothetical protein